MVAQPSSATLQPFGAASSTQSSSAISIGAAWYGTSSQRRVGWQDAAAARSRECRGGEDCAEPSAPPLHDSAVSWTSAAGRLALEVLVPGIPRTTQIITFYYCSTELASARHGTRIRPLGIARRARDSPAHSRIREFGGQVPAARRPPSERWDPADCGRQLSRSAPVPVEARLPPPTPSTGEAAMGPAKPNGGFGLVGSRGLLLLEARAPLGRGRGSPASSPLSPGVRRCWVGVSLG